MYDPLEPTSEPRWYVVRNMLRAVIEARQVAPGADPTKLDTKSRITVL